MPRQRAYAPSGIWTHNPLITNQEHKLIHHWAFWINLWLRQAPQGGPQPEVLACRSRSVGCSKWSETRKHHTVTQPILKPVSCTCIRKTCSFLHARIYSCSMTWLHCATTTSALRLHASRYSWAAYILCMHTYVYMCTCVGTLFTLLWGSSAGVTGRVLLRASLASEWIDMPEI